jgi:hypothetical protein
LAQLRLQAHWLVAARVKSGSQVAQVLALSRVRSSAVWPAAVVALWLERPLAASAARL